MPSRCSGITEGAAVPRRLGFLSLPATVHSVYVTRRQQLTEDTLLRYVYGSTTTKRSPIKEFIFYLLLYPAWANLIRQGKVWGIGAVSSLMVWGSAPSQSQKPESPLSRLIGVILGRLAALSTWLDSAEQKKRITEFKDKTKNCVSEILGARVQDMLCVEALLTVKEHRRKGYASSLVRALTDTADRNRRASWLVSSNIGDNSAFYESLGFRTLGYIVLGDDNPAWTEEPLQLGLMVREFASGGKE